MNEPEEIVCTLYEGDFHKGVVGLANSLHASGFRGAVLVGYRGELPPWSQPANDERIGEHSVQTLRLSSLTIYFLRVETDYHLTNYKPDFMLAMAEAFPSAQQLYYFDPDIVLTSYKWNYFQEWAHFAVALCEDINSPIPENHPQRLYWRKYFAEHGFELKAKGNIYVNGGFVGLQREQLDFLKLWKGIQKAMAPAIGGLSKSSIGKSGTPRPITDDPLYAFWKTDQDALNATVEAYTRDCSIIGKEAMAFGHGAKLMAHAQGRYKPWSKAYFCTTLSGRPPSFAEKEYWKHVSAPISLVSPARLAWVRFKLTVCTVIGRFYRRNTEGS